MIEGTPNSGLREQQQQAFKRMEVWAGLTMVSLVLAHFNPVIAVPCLGCWGGWIKSLKENEELERQLSPSGKELTE